MANEAYAAAHAELTTLVSPRAAEQMLDDALADVDVSREAVTPRQMRALVAGPVQRDLRRTVPPEVSTQVVQKVMERLRAMSTPTPPVTATSPRSSRRDAGAPAPGPERTRQPARGAAAVRGARSATTTPVPSRLAGTELDDAAAERVALTFARLDDVIGVSVVRQNRVRFHRGEGIAADVAAALVPAAASVLGHRGPWRSYTLEHDRGHLFIVPVGRDHLVVVGRTGFNLGAVLTALTRLEEEL